METEPKSSVRHYAVLIGICFTPLRRRSEWQPLKGCVRDVQSMRKQLMKSFPRSDIRMLTASLQQPDDARPSEGQAALPTYRNILSSLERISSKATADSFVYIHFTGHGTAIDSSSPFARNGARELALVVLAGDGSEIQYLRGTELAYQLHCMVEKGLKVTVVLDCCASGSVVRDRLDPSIKYLPYDPAVDMACPLDPERDSAPNEDDQNAGPVHRAASSRLNWLINPDGYVVLAACAPTEKAMELDFGNGQFYGALSYFLIRAFVRRGGFGGKHQHIYSHLVSRFRERCPSQQPMLYGNKTLGFFMGSTAPWHAALIPVVKTATGFQLESGLAHGVCSGDLFAMDLDDPTSELTMTSTSSPVTFKATEVRGLTSDLELLDSNATAAPEASGMTVTAMTRLSLRRFTVGLDLQIPRSEAWSKAVHDRVSLHITFLDGTENTTTFTHIVTVLTSDHYQIQNQGDLIPDQILPKSMYPLEENAEFVLDVIEHLARYWDASELCEPNPSTNPLREQFGASLVASDDHNYLPICHFLGREAQVKEGDSLELVVQNWGTSALYVHVFIVGFLLDIQDLLYASHDVIPQRLGNNARDFLRTRQNSGEWRLRIRMSLPKEVDGIDCCIDDIKVCVTSQPTSFASLEQPKSGELVRLRRKNRHRRGEQDTNAPQEAWAMLTFQVRTWGAAAWEDMMRGTEELDLPAEELDLELD